MFLVNTRPNLWQFDLMCLQVEVKFCLLKCLMRKHTIKYFYPLRDMEAVYMKYCEVVQSLKPCRAPLKPSEMVFISFSEDISIFNVCRQFGMLSIQQWY